MAELRRLRILSALVVGLPWFVLWVAVLVIGAERLAGVDLYARVSSWILVNVAFGIVVLTGSVWVARRVADRPDRPRWMQRLIDDLAGRSLQRVARELEEIDAFSAP